MDAKTKRLYSKLKPCLDGMDGTVRDMTDDMLRTYAWYCVKVKELTDLIDVEGSIVDTPRGTRQNPACDVLHKYSMRKGEYYARLVGVIGKDDKQAADRLAQFVTR